MSSKQENRHAVTSRDLCAKMARKYGWKLKRIDRTGVKDLPLECVFEGEQTSFSADYEKDEN